MTTASPRILVGGVPFGCHNIGDEAILECAIGIFRSLCPSAEFTVSTGEPEATAELLDLATCPLYGFDETYNRVAFRRLVREHDVYIWCGATGLSDYPEEALELLQIAQEEGKKTILWGVGMNSRLNPVKFELLPGKRRALLGLLSAMSLGLKDFVGAEEVRRKTRAFQKMTARLDAADLVVLRDPESRDEVRKAGVSCEPTVGADSALILVPKPVGEIDLSESDRNVLLGDRKTVGVCISTSAPKFTDIGGLVDFFDRLTTETGCLVVFLPMDPVVDLALIRNIQGAMKNSRDSYILEGYDAPAATAGIMSEMDVVLSSRLHMLILASISHVPIVGISPGSKMDNFMRPYGLIPAGTAENCDFYSLRRETERLLNEKETFVERSKEVRAEMLERLEVAKALLKSVLDA